MADRRCLCPWRRAAGIAAAEPQRLPAPGDEIGVTKLAIVVAIGQRHAINRGDRSTRRLEYGLAGSGVPLAGFTEPRVEIAFARRDQTELHRRPERFRVEDVQRLQQVAAGIAGAAAVEGDKSGWVRRASRDTGKFDAGSKFGSRKAQPGFVGRTIGARHEKPLGWRQKNEAEAH